MLRPLKRGLMLVGNQAKFAACSTATHHPGYLYGLICLNRLERNVDIDCAPARLNAEAKKRASERRKQIITDSEQPQAPLDPKAQAAANAAKEWGAQNYPALGGMDMALAALCYQKIFLVSSLVV